MIKKDIIQPINDLIEKQAKELKDKIAYADEIENISYKNLNIEGIEPFGTGFNSLKKFYSQLSKENIILRIFF